MSITMHSASAPVFVRMLGNLLTWLDKAQARADEKKFDPAVLLGARLAPDMLPLTKQIQIACDTAKFAAARLGSAQAPTFEDNETTLDQLRARVHATIEFVKSVPAASVVDSESKEITIPRRDGSMTMKGEDYLRFFVMPNFYFHVTTVYALLRHNGVELGKMDFLGAPQQ
jgi:hypothetical protein